MRKRNWSWSYCFICGGMVASAGFIGLFFRIPHWMGDLAAAVSSTIFVCFVLGGGFLGERIYKRYACGLGLHPWEESSLPRTRDCILCGRVQIPIDPFNETSGWKDDVRLVCDKLTGRISYKD